MEMVTAIFLLSFINIGFISVLQRLMHVLDYDLEGENTSPWRTELLYTLYFAVVTAFVFMMALTCPTPVERLMWVNCVLVLMMSYTDAVKTRLNIILALVLTVALFFLSTTSFSFWLVITLAIGIITLMAERQWFFPFDRHPVVILSVKAGIGAISWLGLTAMLHLSFQMLLMMYIVYLVVTFITYYYMVLIRREHINNVDAARNMLFDNLTHARNWLSFRSDADDYFQNYSTLNVIAMDIDNFKHINDTYGHLAGNTTLIQFSNQLERIIAQQAEGARLYRTGGEEFTILYPGVSEEVAAQLAAVLQASIHDLRTSTEKGQQIKVTVSVGIENRRESDQDAMDIFKRADRLLYQSKRNGKDQISIGVED